MADGIPPDDLDGADEPPPPSEPPPLDSIRVKGQGARGLNKAAILAAAGGGVAVVLLLASGAFTGDPARKPADVKPMMSDPARPEMAKSAIRDLPADYTKVAAPQALPQPVAPPQLGPPLPGDVAAFAQPDPHPPSDASAGDDAWRAQAPYPGGSAIDPREAELQEAERSGIFFALRDPTAPVASARPQRGPAMQPPSSMLTAFAPAPQDQPDVTASLDRALFPGAVISASLVTEVNSESPGPVIAQVTQAVFDSSTGRTLLVPQGARLIGDYRSSTRYGQSRVAIVWSRLIMPDGREVMLAEAALDPSGAAGVSGQIDNHWAEVFGAAALGTLINVGVATTEDPQLAAGGVIVRDPVDGAIADGVQRMASNATNRVVDRGLAVPPTIRVPAGAKLTVIATRRVTF